MTDPLIARTIGNYEIVSRLGKGGMATVYRARQVNMQRDVAIKFMSADLVEDPQFVARFEREARVIANLQHPRILPVHDFGHEGELCYLVMRLVEGESLYHRLQQGPLTLVTAARLLDQIAEALDYAHAEGVVHRDLKPNNILIDEWDNVYLMDFGLAKIAAGGPSLTQSGMVLGTPAYMSPEQWRGATVDARSDVYSLGVILYEMVVGHPPFESDTPFTLMYKHINDAPPPPRELQPDLPQSVEDVILKALAKAPDARYQSAGELAREFGAVVRVAGSLAVRQRSAPGAAPEPEDRPVAPSEEESPVPAPARIFPPPPPIPIAPAGHEVLQGRPLPPRPPRKRHDEMPPEDADQEWPDRVALAPALRQAIEVVDHSLEAAVEKAAQAIPPLGGPSASQPQPPGPVVPATGPAFAQMQSILAADEPLTGVLDVRGTAQWQMWKRLAVGGLALNILGGVLNAGLLGALGWLAWIFLIVQAVRTWRGDIGRYYLGFTPQRVVLLPRGADGAPRYDEAQSTDWVAIERLRLTNRYVLLDMPAGGAMLHFGALLVAQGEGGLGNQLAWLPGSPIPTLIQERGFEAENL